MSGKLEEGVGTLATSRGLPSGQKKTYYGQAPSHVPRGIPRVLFVSKGHTVWYSCYIKFLLDPSVCAKRPVGLSGTRWSET